MKELRYTTSYQIVRKVGEGGVGTVYQAQKLGANGFRKIVAIKTIRRRLLADKETVRLFVGEAKLVANLVHENILQVHQLGMTSGQFYIVMEYAHGHDLNHFLARLSERNLFPPADICSFIISRVARALHHAHTATSIKGKPLDLVHRDVTPSNVIITRHGVVKLTDFGIAKAITMRTPRESKVLMGKLPYMSPEQARYQGTTPRSDIFSLGLIYYELLTGRQVYRVRTYDELIEHITNYAIVPPHQVEPSLPIELSEIVMKALAMNPEARYESAGDFCIAIERWMYADGYGPTNDKLSVYLCDLYADSTVTAAAKT